MSAPRDEGERPESFSDITGRLDEIVRQVRDKSVSLEKSLDLFDEAIALGSKAIDMVDTAAVTGDEKAAAEGSQGGDEASPAPALQAPATGEAADGHEGR